jgi:hypothetical protein
MPIAYVWWTAFIYENISVARSRKFPKHFLVSFN